MKKYLLLTLALIAICSITQARHIIGGEMVYECLGERNGEMQYRFTLLIYRDCSCTNCAGFDENAPIAIYACGVNKECGDLTQSLPFKTFTVPLKQQRDVNPPNFPCLELPPNVCVEEGRYEFETSLPVSAESYHIIYQRCCRNNTITNIYEPEAAGATYSVEITPKAQELCNNSPVFNQFPPTVICVDQPLDFDHSATDADGDQLVYEFCAPLFGGGRAGTSGFPGDPSDCEGVSPTPPCPPPFGTVRYIQPTYTFLTPLGGTPTVAIDPNTGRIAGTPDRLGQYVVGVCVKEYRNGELLSVVKRDFQFNVANCAPTVVADIEKDSIINGQEFIVNSCGENTIQFENKSYRENAIRTWEWQFNIRGNTQTFGEWDAEVTFPGIGQYQGLLVLNPGTECGDTANIFVNVFPEIAADFEFQYDTCVAGPVSFTDLSTTGADEIVSWDWNFGDSNSTSERNPNHTYAEPGDIPVTLRIQDNNRCIGGVTKDVSYFPVPAFIVVAPSEFVGCIPADIFFDNLSTPIDDSYDITWDFGEGGSSNEISPTHTFGAVGVYDVAVEITSPLGCKVDTVFRKLIEMLPSPVADFDINPQDLSNVEPIANFTDRSQNAVRWDWDFSGLGTSTLQHPTFTFPDTGFQVIRQIVTHPSGCQDSILKTIDIVPLVRYFLPNAFTPNNDNSNEGYRGTGILTGVTDFQMTIWNRWGEKVYETNDPEASWNGKKLNTGQQAPNGVYVCLVTFRGPRGKRFEFKSLATVVR